MQNFTLTHILLYKLSNCVDVYCNLTIQIGCLIHSILLGIVNKYTFVLILQV